MNDELNKLSNQFDELPAKLPADLDDEYFRNTARLIRVADQDAAVLLLRIVAKTAFAAGWAEASNTRSDEIAAMIEAVIASARQ